MGKTLETVLEYANEDSASIKKHWIIIFRVIRDFIIKVIVVGFIYLKSKNFLELLADDINNEFVGIPFEIKKFILPVILVLLGYDFLKDLVEKIIDYTTVGLSINNIQIKGKSGLLDIGIINAPLKQVDFARVHKTFWGQILGYGTIEISIGGRRLMMADMIRADEFQDAIVLLQEAQEEGRHIRQAERQEATLAKQTMAQVQAINGLSKTVAMGLTQKSDAIKIEENDVIEEIEMKDSEGEV